MSRRGSVRAALAALRAGHPVLMVDGGDRESEGSVVLAAEHATPEWVAWMVRHTSGLLCAPMPDEVADRLDLPPMVRDNQDRRGTAYTVTVDSRAVAGSGISAADRAQTVRTLADPASVPGDLLRPGHVLPLRARPGGVLERPGQTEAAVDLCRLAALRPVALIAEVVADDGSMAGEPELAELSAAHDLPLITVADLALWRLTHEPLSAPPPHEPAVSLRVHRVGETRVPTPHGTFAAFGYRDLRTGAEHLALVAGDPTAPDAVVRVHSECLTGDVLGSLRCDCGPQLNAALAAVARCGGVVVYLRGQEGRGIGLLAALETYALQDLGRDTVEANLDLGLPVDAREYGAAAAVLADLGVDRLRLLTNNPAKVEGLSGNGVTVTDRLPLVVSTSEHAREYLAAKRDRMGHDLPRVQRSTV